MSLSNELPDMRRDYGKSSLDESQVLANPFLQFEHWFAEAKDSEVMEANAMVLATVSKGRPSQRVVLLKGFSEEGLLFFTNYDSRKGQELADNPFASVCFYWDKMERQIRIEGTVSKAEDETSNTYFQQRGRGSRIGAWASPQSQAIPDRAYLENKVREINERFEGEKIFPRPPYWGGYLLVPDYFEFWQGRSSRLHDRIYFKQEGNSWERGRLAP